MILSTKRLSIPFIFQLSQIHILHYAFRINVFCESPLGLNESWDQLMSVMSVFLSEPLAWAKFIELKKGKLVLLEEVVKEQHTLAKSMGKWNKLVVCGNWGSNAGSNAITFCRCCNDSCLEGFRCADRTVLRWKESRGAFRGVDGNIIDGGMDSSL